MPTTIGFPTTCFPDSDQELLLKAAILEGPEAIEAWQQWKSRVDIDDIDYADFRMVPLLYRNLLSLGVKDPLMDRLKGVYRYSWARNHRVIHRVSKVLDLFQRQGIPTALLKGASLAFTVYRNLGVRYMDDFDLLVPLADAPRAIELLHQSGWRQAFVTEKVFTPAAHSTGFLNPEGDSMDLHWHVLNQCCDADDDIVFWEKARPLEVEGIPTHALCPTDQLFHACIHGARWNTVAPIRWVADAVGLIRTYPDDIDWQRIVELSRRLSLVVPIRQTFLYLSERFGVPIPSSCLNDLKTLPDTPWQRREFLAETSSRRWLDEFPTLWHRYHRTQHSKKHRFKPYGFLRYLQNYCGLDHAWQVPVFLLKRFIPRARKNLARAAG
ncbi:MAG TPA: nucleotidyltransferase family protein [bacterium]|nr:nucleotidyltransferase family protein [bacterium]